MLKKLKFCIAALFAVCLLSAGNEAFAAPICPVPTEVTQPDGTVITVTAYGDEFFSWREDENGNVIAYDEESDSYKYAEIENGELVPTSETVGDTSLLRSAPQRLQREDIMPLWENAERIDYTQPCGNDRIALMSADGEPEQEKPLTHQKLLVLLVEFNDVPIKFDCDFWYGQMFSTNPNDISVANYWKENANGLDIFEPADTSGVQIGREGLASTDNSVENYTDIRYIIDDYSAGVVKVTLDMPHPVRTWNNETSVNAGKAAVLAAHAVESDLDLSNEIPHIVAILAGYDVQYANSAGHGEIHANTPAYGITALDGTEFGRFTVQGEQYNETEAIGIGTICHELGHSVFNLPDLYFNNPIGATPDCGVCSYSLMSSGSSGHRCNSSMPDGTILKRGELPSHLDAWSKIQCGFVTPILKNEWDGNLNSISENGIDSKYNVLEIRSKTDPNQYFLVENRQLIGYDRGLEETNNYYVGDVDIEGGVIIWHIDESIIFHNNGSQQYHPFMWAERSTNEWSPAKWAYTGEPGRNTFNGETTPNSNFHQPKVGGNYACTDGLDCHPQTLKSGISIEVLSENGPSMHVRINVDEEYHVSMKEGATFTDLFPDANFCRAVLDIMKEKDGIVRNPENVLTIRDWAVLTGTDHMDISGYGIKDLTGIEYFPVLHRLGCSDNEITEISSAQIPDLDSLVCYNNKLTKLDLSQWVNLEFLYCENNLLTELDTSNNVHLWDVKCSDNRLTELDFSNSPELTSLYCQNNELTSLNVSNSEPLYDLVCSDNLLTSLDTSHNPELVYLECANNKLTGLDLTGNPILEWLWCYGNFMDTETPGNSILGLEQLEYLGEPQSNEVLEYNTFAYYPQNVPDTEHSWDSAWQKNDTHHWHNCTDADCPIANNADKDGYGEHAWNSGDVTNQPTCSAAGVKTYTCTICQAIKTEELAATGVHAPGEWETVTPATTKQVGLRVKRCTVCHVELEREPIPKLKPAPPGPDPTPTPAPTPTWENPFVDVAEHDWYYSAVRYATENGLFYGTSNTTFSPHDYITRGMLATVIYRLAKEPETAAGNLFNDVADGKYYTEAIAWAAENGIVAGYGNNRFGPEDSITREQLAAILWRYAGSPEVSGTLDRFTDGSKTSTWAVSAMRWAVSEGIMNGNGNGTIDPTGKATRAEAAAMVKKYRENKACAEG